MKFRAVANGNILEDVPIGLVNAGIYVPVEEVTEAPAPPAEPIASESTPVAETPADPPVVTEPPAPVRRRASRTRR